MSTFKAGQKVVCVVEYGSYWASSITRERMAGPERGEICTVAATHGQYLILKEWDCGGEGWNSRSFRPANPFKVHQELIEQFELSQVPEAPELIPQTA